jgi:hypothetical protein
MMLQAVNVAIHGEPLSPAAFDLDQVVVEDHLSVLYRSQFLPEAIEAGSGRGTSEVVDAAIKGVALAGPRGTQAAGTAVQLKDV